MIKLTVSKIYPSTKDELFNLIEDIHRLSIIKKEIAGYRIARDELGLQIIDTDYRLPFIKIASRLRYTIRPGKYTELKQTKGKFKNYVCKYSFKNGKGGIIMEINLIIQLPFGPFSYILSIIMKPAIKLRLLKELKTIGKLIEK